MFLPDIAWNPHNSEQQHSTFKFRLKFQDVYELLRQMLPGISKMF